MLRDAVCISVLTTIALLLMANPTFGGENNWVTFLIRNNCSESIYLEDALLEYGKWYKTGMKSFEYASVNQEVPSYKSVRINACGRLLSPTGTNGQFALFTRPKQDLFAEEIAFFNFEIFFGIQENTLQVPYVHDKYKIKLSPWRHSGPDMGFISILVTKIEP